MLFSAISFKRLTKYLPTEIRLEKVWEQNNNIHQPFVDFKHASDSTNRSAFYEIFKTLEIRITLEGIVK